MRKILLIFVLMFLVPPGLTGGHETLVPEGPENANVGVIEKTGQIIPPDIEFSDENGRKVTFKDLLGKPVILTLVYYTCEHICPQMLGGLSQTLPRLAYAAGKDYRVVTISFDVHDTPEAARDTKKNYIKATDTVFPEDGWKFLTGSRESIDRLTEAVGFSYKKDSHGFTHPVILIFLTSTGRISSYYYVTKFQYGAAYPITFTSFDLNMGLTGAIEGKAVSGFKKAVLYCFSHEPPGQSKFFRFMAGVGTVTLAALIGFFIYLQVTTRKYRREKGYVDK